ncbi:uncharacterized protein CTRU02_214408 [Colletotrichum truncatum]|uniref:Uncharacterized protein n=1 Tax=Colletotrichum truncatum TaxID=5467 RepID=A0ACC3YEN5_COLTU|nr:uncharacterized protein CTRU02_13487 [Colletotrichum truncatum]KAF6783251.1 hypothetical protein CTRU02_13487 [Colletotrichum truncatum]
MSPPQLEFPSTGPSIFSLIAKSPPEINTQIFSHLTNSDLKILRLTNTYLANLVGPHIRFKRAYISANARDIEVFRAVAEHETFRHREMESGYEERHYYEDLLSEDETPPPGVPFWFFRACQENVEYLDYRRGKDVRTIPQHVETAQQLASALSPLEAYKYYQGLLEQRDKVLAASSDMAAFEWAIENDKFPNLQRITLTPAAHGILFKPLYQTPLIRSFPYGFNYPLPRGWPTPNDGSRIGCENWENGAIKNKWRGNRAVTPRSLQTAAYQSSGTD